MSRRMARQARRESCERGRGIGARRQVDEQRAQRSPAGSHPRTLGDLIQLDAAQPCRIQQERLAVAAGGARERREVLRATYGVEEPGRGAYIEHAARMLRRARRAGTESARASAKMREAAPQNERVPATCWQQMTGYPTRRWKLHGFR